MEAKHNRISRRLLLNGDCVIGTSGDFKRDGAIARRLENSMDVGGVLAIEKQEEATVLVVETIVQLYRQPT